MNNNFIPLHQLPLGKYAIVKKITVNGNTRRRMLDLGLITDTCIEPVLKSISGGLTAYSIRGAVIALRSDITSKILVEAV